MRLLITDFFLRSDEGQAADDFVLYDRKKKVLYSIAHGERQVLVIAHEDFDSAVPESLTLKQRRVLDKAAPRISGKLVYAVSLYSGDELCQRSMVVPGLLTRAVVALREFRSLLASRQYRDLDKTPPELRSDCFLANYVYAVNHNLKEEFPIQESNQAGWRRTLVDYETGFAADPALFVLPNNYSRFAVP